MFGVNRPHHVGVVKDCCTGCCGFVLKASSVRVSTCSDTTLVRVCDTTNNVQLDSTMPLARYVPKRGGIVAIEAGGEAYHLHVVNRVLGSVAAATIADNDAVRSEAKKMNAERQLTTLPDGRLAFKRRRGRDHARDFTVAAKMFTALADQATLINQSIATYSTREVRVLLGPRPGALNRSRLTKRSRANPQGKEKGKEKDEGKDEGSRKRSRLDPVDKAPPVERRARSTSTEASLSRVAAEVEAERRAIAAETEEKRRIAAIEEERRLAEAATMEEERRLAAAEAEAEIENERRALEARKGDKRFLDDMTVDTAEGLLRGSAVADGDVQNLFDNEFNL